MLLKEKKLLILEWSKLESGEVAKWQRFRVAKWIMINIVLFVFSVFVIRLFFSLSKKYNKYLFLFPLSGILLFLISYFLFSVLSFIVFSLLFKSSNYLNEIVISCFTIPFAIITSGIYYKFLENKFKKDSKKASIKDIVNS